MDRLTSMAVFVKAIDLGSFAAAAAALDLSGPMVGKHVRFLEERLGMRLINRTTRRQNLTDVGRAYYDRCRVVLAEAEAADALATDQLSEPRGKLRVTMPVHFGRHCVTPVLLELARQYPALELDLSFSDRIVDLAEDGYDLAIRTGDLDDKAGVIARRVARQRMVVCAAPAYLGMHGRPGQVEDLPQHHAIIYRRSGRIRPWLFPRPGQPPLEVTPVNRLRLDDLDAIADVAAAGMGLAWLPSWLVRERIQAGALVVVLPDQPEFLYDGYALWPQTPHLPLKVRLAVDALAAALPRFMT
ncbi:LysR family transcriptional regulator [Phreatobacter stygius]|uniref:LysR family transcriptional regulator n=1 Tax=Phreatobacter stygius TaxID=1940610 RepID=A0A4D7AVN6_9HYPH|nr:LysR family transcriptional regulator [Phreatobacter stygius]QCI63063.1 LysR family transcriptional regulator [Phreatobacter stygius]